MEGAESEQHSIGRRLLPPRFEAQSFLIVHHGRAHDEEVLHSWKLLIPLAEDVARDPVCADAPLTGVPAKFIVHLPTRSPSYCSYRSCSGAASLDLRGGPEGKPADFVDGVLALVEHRGEKGLHLG